MRIKCISFGVIIFFACSCSDKHNMQIYKMYPKKLKANNVIIKSSIETDLQKGELKLNLLIKNNSNQNININYFDAALIIDSYRRTLPKTNSNYKTEIAPDDKEEYELIFRPINSLDLYKRMGYRGDMKKQYSLKLDFIKFTNDSLVSDNSIDIRMEEDKYCNHITNYGINSKVNLFNIINKDESFILKQKNHLKNLATNRNLSLESEGISDQIVIITNTDIILNNRVLKLSGYQLNDTLFMRIGVVNKAKEKLIIDLNESTIFAGKMVLQPVEISINNNEVSSNERKLNLMRGGRLFASAKYCIPNELDEFSFNMNWLCNGSGKNVKLLAQDVLFMRLNKEL